MILGTEGWKERYYRKKLNFKFDKNNEILEKLCYEYIRGLCWVMLYYYQGCASWSWYYPFHYAPFASDLINTCQFEITFDKSKPFKPYGQLMGVLPAASGHALPKQFANLMTHPSSPIIDFYPTDFALDLNGKKFAWQVYF